MIMEQYLLQIIGEISQKRKDKGEIPTAARMSEIQNRMTADAKDILNRLCKDGVLEFHRLLNDVSFERK